MSDARNVSRAQAVEILGAPISVIDMTTAIERLASWVGEPEGRYVCVADVHSVMLTRTNEEHKAAFRSAAMVTPDGMPLVWVSRLLGFHSVSRVCGPDLLAAVCAHSEKSGWRHYFYGGAPGVVDELMAMLQARHPKLEIVGADSPPFRPLTEAEDAEAVRRIRAAKPDIIWIGLGCPKQEKWMMNHAPRIPGATLIGVGAAFDFHAGRVKRAPLWMQRRGLEWLYRLVSEPRRLWRRYLILAPRFALLAGKQLLLGRRKDASVP